MCAMLSLSAPLQMQCPAGQLRDVPACGEEVPVWLVQQRRQMHHETALSSHLPLRQPLAGPLCPECQVYQPSHHWGGFCWLLGSYDLFFVKHKCSIYFLSSWQKMQLRAKKKLKNRLKTLCPSLIMDQGLIGRLKQVGWFVSSGWQPSK